MRVTIAMTGSASSKIMRAPFSKGQFPSYAALSPDAPEKHFLWMTAARSWLWTRDGLEFGSESAGLTATGG
ncbi:hypothetical protein GCM10028772_12900 [Nocardioides ultimimeridianus]